MSKESTKAMVPGDIFNAVLMNSSQFNWKLFQTLTEVYSVCLKTLSQNNTESPKNLAELERILRSKIRNVFDTRFRTDDFVNTLADTIATYSDLANITGFGNVYQYLSNLSSLWNNYFVEPIRDAFWRTASEKISELEKYSLFVYRKIAADTYEKKYPKTPLLIVYAFINRMVFQLKV